MNELDLLRLVKELGKGEITPTESINSYYQCKTCGQYIYVNDYNIHVLNCKGK